MEVSYWHCYTSLFLIFSIFVFKLFSTNKPSKYKNLPPSPPTLPLIGHLHLLKQPIHTTFQSLSRNYGKVLLLQLGSRKLLLVSSASVAQECFTKNDIVFTNRPNTLFSKHFSYNYTTVASAPYGDHWRNLRRIMTLEIFSSSRLVISASIRREEVRSLLDQIMRSYNKGMPKLELKSKFFELSFNVMTMMMFGKRYYGENVADLEEAKKIRRVIKESIELSGSSNVEDFLPILQLVDIRGLEKKMAKYMVEMDKFLQDLIDERRRTAFSDVLIKKDKKLLIDNLLAQQQIDPNMYTDQIIKGIIMVSQK